MIYMEYVTSGKAMSSSIHPYVIHVHFQYIVAHEDQWDTSRDWTDWNVFASNLHRATKFTSESQYSVVVKVLD